MKISDLMSTDVVTTTPDATLRDVARMLVEHKVSGLPVCDDAGTVVGVVSQGDILFKEQGPIETRDGLLGWLLDAPSESDLEKARARTAGEAMTHPPVTAVPQTVRPVRASTPTTSPEAKGTTASCPSVAGLAPPSSPVPPVPCTRQSVSPLRAPSP